MLSRDRILSTANTNSVTSPFSPLSNNLNHMDQNSRSMSPGLSEQSTLNIPSQSNMDSSALVCFSEKTSSRNLFIDS